MAEWQTCDQKISGSRPGRKIGGIFFSMVNGQSSVPTPILVSIPSQDEGLNKNSQT